MNTVILAVFIASASFFEAALPVGGAYQQMRFANTDEGIKDLGRWIEKTGVTAFDHVCVTGPPIETTPARQFWSTRKSPVYFMSYDHYEDYIAKRNVTQGSARLVLSACYALLETRPAVGK